MVHTDVRLIILSNPPAIPATDELPGWTALLSSQNPVFVPTRHRFADIVTRNSFITVRPDSDDVLRQSNLWQLNSGVISPSLPLAVDFESSEAGAGSMLVLTDYLIFFSSYAELPRIDVRTFLSTKSTAELKGATVFLDSDLPVIDASAILPSGQLVTISEITATLLADVENNRNISTSASVKMGFFVF